MTFAICYELPDVEAMGQQLNSNALPSALRNEARRYWNGGLNAYATSPVGVFPGSNAALCPSCHIITCTYGTLPAFVQILRGVSAAFQSAGTANDATRYLLALADDLSTAPGIGKNDSGREPYP